MGKEHATILSVNAPKEVDLSVTSTTCFSNYLLDRQLADVEGACQGLLGLTAY